MDKKFNYTKAQIQQITRDILQSYQPDIFPVKVVALAHDMDLKVFETEFDRDDVSGMIKAKEGKIYICKSDIAERQRFSIAHELGHYVLHYRGGKFEAKDQDEHVSYRDTLSSLGFSIKEMEANYFAANLLMPTKEVKRLYKLDYSLEEMADYFLVSKAAMGYRLESLELEA